VISFLFSPQPFEVAVFQHCSDSSIHSQLGFLLLHSHGPVRTGMILAVFRFLTYLQGLLETANSCDTSGKVQACGEFDDIAFRRESCKRVYLKNLS